MSGETYITGHSLGAARAYQYAYSRIKRGLRVDGIYCLAPPKPGDKAIGQILFANRAGMVVRALKNRRDYVPCLPVSIELIGEEFDQPWRLDEINELPTNPIGADPDHAIALYQVGARKVPDNPGVAITLGDAADQIAMLYQTAVGWDWINPVDGQYVAMRKTVSGAKQLIFRGSVSALDWLDDFDASEVVVQGAKMSRGFWAGIGPIEDKLDAALA